MRTHIRLTTLVVFLAASAWPTAQEAKPKQEFWVQKVKTAVYAPPNKPHTKLSDLKAKYKGQATWKETVVKDSESQADYVSMAPGTKVSPRFHPATPSFIAVFGGEMRWQIENQEPFTAKRGSIVNIPSWTIFSYDVIGAEPAVFIEVNAIHFDTVYPATGPAPEPLPGRVVVKAAFNERKATPYVAPNKPHFNLHDSIKTNPARPGGVQVLTEHLYANANYGFADPNDPANPNRGRPARPARTEAPSAPFDPKVPGGHLHPGSVEWWIVLTGHISAKFESGAYIAEEGDILYAPPYMLHAMANYGPGGSCRVAIGWYNQEHFDPVVPQQ